MKMKRDIFIVALITSFFISACRKGEDDPLLSLRTRKARLTGDWQLDSGKVQTKFVDDQGKFTERTFNFTANSYVSNVGGIGTFTGPHFIKLKIGNDGHFSVEEQADSVGLTGEGRWDLMSKGSGYKNKERVFFSLSKAKGNSLEFAFFNKTAGSFKYGIKELRNKRLVLECKEEFIYEVVGKYSCFVTAEYSFKQP
jgi:hypothetical protein